MTVAARKPPVLSHYLSGKTSAATGARTLEVPNPATGEIIALVPLADRHEVDAAVASAKAAFPAWRDTPVVARAQVMFRYKALCEANIEELAALITREHGKTHDEARAEVRRGVDVIDFACGIPSLMLGDTLEGVSSGLDMEVYHQPLGVVAGITPFNFPFMVPMWMIPLALACGNTFVLKPSERTPHSGVRLAELFTEAGLPDGVLNVVHGDKVAVDALLEHPDVKAVSFVGSQPVAEHVYRHGSAHGKRVQAMAGAKNYMIVMPDADLDQTVPSIISSAFANAGERCLAGAVVVAVGEIGDPLVVRLSEAARRITVGDGSENPDMGPLIREGHRDRVAGYVASGQTEGATVAYDGRNHQVPSSGAFLGPTVLDHVRPEMTVAREEIFGPVLSVMRADSLEHAIELANASDFGNSASLYTASGWAARTFRNRIEAGMLGINIGVPAPMPFLPFAGWKKSFYGDLHANGKDAISFYTERKVSTIRWFEPRAGGTGEEWGRLKK